MIFRSADATDKKGHHLIADQLVNDCIVPDQDVSRAPIEAVEQRRVGARLELLAQRSGPPYVREEYGYVYFCPTRGQALASVNAEGWVFPRRCEPEQADQLAADSPERIVAHLAPWWAGQIAEKQVHEAERPMPLSQNLSPEVGTCAGIHARLSHRFERSRRRTPDNRNSFLESY